MRFAIYSILVAVFLCACNSTTKVVDKSHVDSEISVLDSLKAKYYASGRLTGESSAERIKTSDSTVILLRFVGSGGTYDVNTGKASGVESVEQVQVKEGESENVRVLTDSIAHLWEIIEQGQDSAVNVVEMKDVSTEESKGTSWWVWFVVGGVLTFALIVVIKKVPQTSWLLFWL